MFNFIVSVMQTGGYVGIFFLMVLENLFPLIPSEIIVPLAGFIAASGKLNVFLVLLASSLGSFIGAVPWFLVGYYFGVHRLKKLTHFFGRWIGFSHEDVDVAQAWFVKFGHLAVLFGRVIPGVRGVISIPAGIARMSFMQFTVYSCIGIVIWNSLLLFCGYILQSQYEKVSQYTDKVLILLFVAVGIFYIYRVVTFKKSVVPMPPQD